LEHLVIPKDRFNSKEFNPQDGGKIDSATKLADEELEMVNQETEEEKNDPVFTSI
jgi:hypothetical protein